MKLLRYALLFPLVKNITESYIDNVIRDKVEPVRGSVLYCDLFLGYAEHSGIYIGNGLIIHKNCKGAIEIVTPEQFISGTTALSIYVSCFDNSAIGLEQIALRAESLLNHQQEYNFITRNCHQFCSYCLTGDKENYNISLALLKNESANILNSNEWRAWDYK